MKRRSFLKILGITPCVGLSDLSVAKTSTDNPVVYAGSLDEPLMIIADISAQDTTASIGSANLHNGKFCTVKAVGTGNNKLVVDGEYILHSGESMAFSSDGTQWRVI